MKQFWTPLARVFGVVDPLLSTKPPAEQVSKSPMWSVNATQWPELFNALRKHAEHVWCSRSIRHSEVNPQEILSIRQIHIQASSELMSQQVNDWFAETDVPHLIQWMVNGPFHTEQIKSLVEFQHLEGLVLHPYAKPAEGSIVSPYMLESQEASQDLNFTISDVSQWQLIDKEKISNDLTSPIDILIEDGSGSRHIQVQHSKLIVGAEKMVVFPDGQQVELKDQSEIIWNNEFVFFIHCNSKYVSGLHLLVSKSQEGFLFQDLSSTNGTYWGSERMTDQLVQSSDPEVFLSVGGPFSEPPENASRVRFRSPRHFSKSGQGYLTPLRSLAADKQPEFQFILTHTGPVNPHSFSINTFPFVIGRDLTCEGVVSTVHIMVSRRHLIVLTSDQELKRIQIQDVSRYGLTTRNGIPIGREPVWLNLNESILLGHTDEYSGISLSLSLV